MDVAVKAHPKPRKATVVYVDRQQGVGKSARHKVRYEDGSEAFVYSQNILKSWADYEPEHDALVFAEKQQQIQNEIRKQEQAKKREPLDNLVNLLALEGIEAQVEHRYMRRQSTGTNEYGWVVSVLDSAKFNDVLAPILTKRVLDRTFGSTLVEDSDEFPVDKSVDIPNGG